MEDSYLEIEAVKEVLDSLSNITSLACTKRNELPELNQRGICREENKNA